MIILQYQNNSIVLVNPTQNEEKIVGVKTTFTHAMNGDIHSTKYTPPVDSFSLPFEEIAQSKVDELIDFIILSSGEVIQYIDPEGETWDVVIITEPQEILETNIYGIYSFTLELESV